MLPCFTARTFPTISELENIMKSKLSSLDINFVKGGQPVYYYIISVESE